jgi:intermembrane space import and assembly protein 40
VSEHEAPLSTGGLEGGAAGLEEEAGSQGAFNPETGEINWDCPCLGGMADGPCGPEFKEAFSCFVFSTEEPKGMDCIDKFQNMQQCFQRHPEVYKGELEDDEELDAELEGERQELVKEIAERKAQQEQREGGIGQQRLLEEPAPAPASGSSKSAKSVKKSKSKNGKQATSESQNQPVSEGKTTTSSELLSDSEVAHEAPSAVGKKPAPPPVEESAISEGDLIPKAAHDARGQVGVPEKETEK